MAGKPLNTRLNGLVPMVPPSMDHEEGEFCYYRRPTDVIGWKVSREAVQVTAPGYVFTHNNGELMFFAGNSPRPLEKRNRTLHKGYLPVVEYSQLEETTRYNVQMFSRPLGGEV